MNTKQITAVLCVAILLAVGAAVALTHGNSNDDGKSPWSPSGIVGSIPESAPALEDDFYLNVNYDVIKNAQVIQESSLLSQIGLSTAGQLVQIYLTEATSMEQKLLQQINAAYANDDLREDYGLEELMPHIDDLMAAEDLDDLTAFLTSGSYMLNDPLIDMSVGMDYKNSGVWTIYVKSPGLSFPDSAAFSLPAFNAAMDKITLTYNEFLVLLGYSEEEAESMNEKATEFEIRIAPYCYTSDFKNHSIDYVKASYNPYTIEELAAASPTFPIVDILSSQGYVNDIYIIEEPGWLEEMNELYVEENFEALRTFLLRSYVMNASQFMNADFFNAYLECKGLDASAAKGLLMTGNGLPVYNWLINAAYLDMYGPSKATTDTITELFNEIRDAFAERIESITWMTEETRANALEKLYNMEIYVGGPIAPDYSGLELPSVTGTGGPLADYIAADMYLENIDRSKINTSDYKTHMFDIRAYTANAVYVMNCNSILVTAAFLQSEYLDSISPDSSMEKKLAGLGFVLGHEITHGFDATGMYFDKDSNFNNWWTDSERERLESEMKVYSDYFSTFDAVPFGTHVDGDLVRSEAVADLGSMATMLDIARSIDGFDYEEFYKTWCGMWYQVMTPQYAQSLAEQDVHPYCCYRVNATIQQFQEFYDTFVIEEGDGMYLSPEDRYLVW